MLDFDRDDWEDNDVGVRKSDFDDEDDYMDAVRDRWMDNSVGVEKDDYDTLDDYLDAVRDEMEYRSETEWHEKDYSATNIMNDERYQKLLGELEAKRRELKIQRKLTEIQNEQRRNKKRWIDVIFPGLRDIPTPWLVIGGVSLLILLIELIL